ncbi:MAG: hypothetical protein KBB14_01065 [Thermoanaerobaculia bacterium]|jgi:hypothetical protein|nr:hypothetical protein [Thermoanaerobaculia bacterium]
MSTDVSNGARPVAGRTRPASLSLLAALLVLLSACGKMLSPPPQPRTDGYSGLVTIRAGGAELAKFRIDVRNEAFRRTTSDAKDAPYFVRESAAGPVWEVDPASKSYREATEEALFAHLDDFPLGADFNHAAEANRRGITKYHRESDAVFAGNACAIWRYADDPEVLNSPTTTYWMAPALGGVVIRKVRTVPKDDGTEEVTYFELTHLRAGVDPERFRVPEGFRKEGTGGG